jgi:hypothetical protein
MSTKTVKASLLQTLGLITYIGLISIIFWQGNSWFAPLNAFWGPVLFLSLFVISALVCAIIALGYPIKLFFVNKKRQQAINTVLLTATWLILFFLGLLTYFLIFFKA